MKPVRSVYQKQAGEKLTPDEVRVLTRGLVEQGMAPAIIVSRWAFAFGIVAVAIALVALVVAVAK